MLIDKPKVGHDIPLVKPVTRFARVEQRIPRIRRCLPRPLVPKIACVETGDGQQDPTAKGIS